MQSLKWILVAGETVFNFWTTRARLRHQQVINFTTITKHTMSIIAIHTHVYMYHRLANSHTRSGHCLSVLTVIIIIICFMQFYICILALDKL